MDLARDARQYLADEEARAHENITVFCAKPEPEDEDEEYELEEAA